MEISEIKLLRKKIGLTQHELAARANVSQSLIAKIESGHIDPSYSNAKKLFETLNSLEKSKELTAKQIMHKKIISVPSGLSLREAITIMRKNNISQLPVIDENKIIGHISESLLIDKIIEGDTNSTVRDIMQTAPPILPPDTKQSVIANLLKHFPLVMIEEKGVLVGLITKADLLRIYS